MKKSLTVIAALVMLVLPVSIFADSAMEPEVDVDLMQFMEETNDSFISNLYLKKKEESVGDAELLVELSAMLEDHFTDWGKSEKAIALSKDGTRLANELAELAKASEFERAVKLGVEFSNTCKACHEIFE